MQETKYYRNTDGSVFSTEISVVDGAYNAKAEGIKKTGCVVITLEEYQEAKQKLDAKKKQQEQAFADKKAAIFAKGAKALDMTEEELTIFLG